MLTFLSPGDLPDPGIELRSCALQANSLPSEPPGNILKVHSVEVTVREQKDDGDLD